MNRRRLLGLAIIGVFFCSMFVGLDEFSLTEQNASLFQDLDSPIAADSDVEASFTGEGANQKVRTYLTNSTSLVHQNGSMQIDAPSGNSRLTEANASFYFERNHTTTYQFEDDSPMEQARNVTTSSTYNLTTEGDFAVNGTIDGTDADITGDNPVTYMNITSIADVGKDIVNMTIDANFSGILLNEVVFPNEGPNYDYDYHDSLGVRFEMDLQVNLSSFIWFNISVWDWVDNEWDSVGISAVNATKKKVEVEFVNTNLRYINATETARFHLNFSRAATSDFNLTLYNVNASAILAMEAPIGSTDWTALEFDLRGDALVHGAYIWIRTLDTDFTGGDINLTLSVYRANQTGVRQYLTGYSTTPSNYIMTSDTTIRARPDWDQKFYEVNYTNYAGDGYVLFNFSLDEAQSALFNLSNYFIVINSTTEVTPRYSLVIIPSERASLGSYPSDWFPLADKQQRVDHLLLSSDDSGITWGREFLDDLDENLEQSGPCDAAPFALNLTRRWIPEEVNASIQYLAITAYSNTSAPYNETSPLQWGLGRWTNVFPEEIQNKADAGFDYFRIDLNWTRSMTASLWFNCDLKVKAYSIEEASSVYNYSLSRINWYLNYTLDFSQYSTINWSYVEFWYLFPNDWTTEQLMLPDWSCDNSSAVIQNNLTDVSEYAIRNSSEGIFSLKLNSPNYLFNVTSYINFNGTDLWPSTSFMAGDNISVMVGVRDPAFSPEFVKNGDANCTIYDFAGNLISAENWLNDSIYDEIYERTTLFKFNESVLYEIPLSITPGKYYLLNHWNNGSEIGCKRVQISITYYNISIQSIYQNPQNDATNLAQFSVKKNNATSSSFNIIALSGNSSGVENLEVADYGINQTGDGSVGNLILSEFIQNETFLNPGEWIEFNLTIRNTHPSLKKTIRVEITLSYMAKEEWELLSISSDSITLNITGGINDTATLNLSTQVPTQYGRNCPLRYSGLKTTVDFFEDEEDLGAFLIDQKFSILSDLSENQYDGYPLVGNYLGSVSGNAFYTEFTRDGQVVLPGYTDYFIYIMDENGLTNAMRANKTQFSKIQTELVEVEIDPTSINWNRDVTIEGKIQDELENPVGGITLAINQFKDGALVNVVKTSSGNTVIVNADGTFAVTINTNQFDKYQPNHISFTWAGDSDHLALEANVSLPLTYYSNAIAVSVQGVGIIEGNKMNELQLTISNTGNSTLLNVNITEIQFGTYGFALLRLDQSELASLAPGEFVTVTYRVTIPRLSDELEFNTTIKITAEIFETGEILSEETLQAIDVGKGSFFSFTQTMGVALIFVGIALAWILLVAYIVRQRKRSHIESEKLLAEKSPAYEKGKGKARARAAKDLKPSKPEGEKAPAKPTKETSLDDLLKEAKKD